MQQIFLILFLIFVNIFESYAQKKDFVTTFETTKGTETPTYPEVIRFYKKLATRYPELNIQEFGMTDSGHPLHLVTWNPTKNFNYKEIRSTKRILLINNGIHPGESDGIDATMLLFRDLAVTNMHLPENTIIATIPIYNIGGALERNTGSRTNQNGPTEYGFRGNARNYDLNRDFIKSDTRNSKAFAEIFHLVKPDLFIDNHVSNGADYQYTLTHLFTQHNKLGGRLGEYLNKELQPALEKELAVKGWDITPYVNVWGTTPDHGWPQFLDTPRYSTGYTTLWNTLGMMVETHMLKPYAKRVQGTYQLMKTMIGILENDGAKIRALRTKAIELQLRKETYPLQFSVDTTKSSEFLFKGYEGSIISSKITGLKRLYYDRSKPFEKLIPYQNFFVPTKQVRIPKAYVIPKGWHNVIDLLKINTITFDRLKEDTTMTVEYYRIKNYKTRNKPYEGHYPHYETQVESVSGKILFKKGDILVPTAQDGIRYLLETLEPEAVDSFFNWNFFDTILQQKEGFSPYVWEDKALELLATDDELRLEFLEKKKDTVFANNSYAQLDWIHKRSKHYEKAHLRYPIYRLMK